MNQEDPRSDLWTFLVGSPKPHPATIPLEYQRLTPHLSKKKNTPHLTNIHDLKIYPTPVKHSWSQKQPYTCQTFVISKKKNTPHLTNIRDLKKILHTCQTFVISKKPTPNKHPRSTVKKKKYPTPNKHPRSQKKKYPTPNKHPQPKFIFTWKIHT